MNLPRNFLLNFIFYLKMQILSPSTRHIISSRFAKRSTLLCYDNNENNNHLQLSHLRLFYLHCLEGHKSYQLINMTQKPPIS